MVSVTSSMIVSSGDLGVPVGGVWDGSGASLCKPADPGASSTSSPVGMERLSNDAMKSAGHELRRVMGIGRGGRLGG